MTVHSNTISIPLVSNCDLVIEYSNTVPAGNLTEIPVEDRKRECPSTMAARHNNLVFDYSSSFDGGDSGGGGGE